jgi:hypothetical protein
METDHGKAKKKFGDEIAIADRIDAVLTNARKTELTGDERSIQDDSRSGERTRSEGQNICSSQAITEPVRVALERFDLGKHVMSEKDRLGALQMRVTRHDNIDMLLREMEQRALQRAKAGPDLSYLRLDVEPQIERGLIVAAARGVQFRARDADSFRQRRFDVHVHVLERLVPLKFSVFDLDLNFAQSFVDFLPLLRGEDSGMRERGSMGDGAGDIMSIKPPIERNRLAVTLRDLCCRVAKSTSPHNQLNFGGDTPATTAFFRI